MQSHLPHQNSPDFRSPDGGPFDLLAVFIRGELLHQVLLALCLISAIPLTGCDTLQKKHEAPVMSEAPRRIERPERDEEEEKYVDRRAGDPRSRQIKEVSATDVEEVRSKVVAESWDDWIDDSAIYNSQVAAMVNGAPILNGEVLDRAGGQIEYVKKTMQQMAKNPQALPPNQRAPLPKDFIEYREAMIQQSIADMIKKKLLVERLKSGLKPDQVKMMNAHIDDMFEREIQHLKEQLNVTNKTELELEMKKHGTSLQSHKERIALDALSRECMNLKSEKPKPIERPDLVAYYQENPDKFKIAARVKWEQIQISSSDKKAARKKMDLALAELKKGTPFADVARRYSDGGNAKEGGVRDWMERGNLADTELEEMLFTMPINRLSNVHEFGETISVVRVTDRTPDSRKPFKEVQSEIQALLVQEQNQQRHDKFFKDLFSQAVIETKYSLPQFVPEE